MANPEVWGIVESNQCFFVVLRFSHLQGILAALGTAAVSSGGFLLLLVTWQISIWYTPKTNMEPEKTPIWTAKSSSKPFFGASMLIFGEVTFVRSWIFVINFWKHWICLSRTCTGYSRWFRLTWISQLIKLGGGHQQPLSTSCTLASHKGHNRRVCQVHFLLHTHTHTLILILLMLQKSHSQPPGMYETL